MERHIRIKFLDEPEEKERVSQKVQAIIERFDSESLMINNISNDLYFNDTPLQQLEDMCIIYDLNELKELKEMELLKDFLSKYPGVDSYPNVCSLLKLMK